MSMDSGAKWIASNISSAIPQLQNLTSFLPLSSLICEMGLIEIPLQELLGRLNKLIFVNYQDSACHILSAKCMLASPLCSFTISSVPAQSSEWNKRALIKKHRAPCGCCLCLGGMGHAPKDITAIQHPIMEDWPMKRGVVVQGIPGQCYFMSKGAEPCNFGAG